MSAGTTTAPAEPRPEPEVDAAAAAGGRPDSAVRVEIQALRAIAVVIVVVCHFRPETLPGGFVGVDVFFAISGFLITSHLLREVDRTGTVRLAGFWARRARRILPAAILVLAVCAVAVLAFVPELRWEQFFREIRASALYVENWQLARDSADYFFADERPSPVQHFWSLSAEEQFYLIWPVLILVAATLGRRAIAAALVAVTLASLAYSIYKTPLDQASAYFVTPTRAWEFGLGGLLALVAVSRASPAIRAAASWLGILAIAYAAKEFSGATEIPGYKALLPVLGALAIMWAGAPRAAWGPTRLFGLRPVQYVGDISYGVYLWHWPLLMLAPFVIVGGVPGPILIVLMLVLAALTKRYVEDPIRHGRWLRRRPALWTLAGAAVASGVVVAIAAGATDKLERDLKRTIAHSRAVTRSKPDCYGAAARDRAAPCRNPALRLTVVPAPLEARQQRNACPRRVEKGGPIYVCSFGVKADEAVRTVLLVGDSHAAHWRAAVDVVADQRRWRGYSLTHTGCPLSTTVHLSLKGAARTECRNWNREVYRWLGRHPEVKTVFVSAIAGGARDHKIDVRTGYLEAWKALPKTVENLVVLRDTPRVRGVTDDCVDLAIKREQPAGEECKVSRAGALSRDPEVTAAKRLDTLPVEIVDLNRFICDKRWCYPVVGGVLVYRDTTHVTELFGRTLGAYMARELDSAS